MTSILAIDTPSVKEVSCTGWAYGEFSADEPYNLKASGVVPGGFSGFCRETKLQELLQTADIVVCEKWVTYNSAGDSSPQLTEGVIRFLRSDVVLQPSSGKNTLVPDEVLKRLGYWNTSGHHRDALEATRHALVYLAQARHKPTLRALRQPRR